MRDPWAVLGVEPGADFKSARHAYLVRSQLLHPDRHQGANSEVLEAAEQAMKELNEAWATVQEQIRRSSWPASPPHSDPSNTKSSQTQSQATRPSGTADYDGTRGTRSGRQEEAFPDPQACLDWVIGSLLETGHALHAPLDPDEVVLLTTPIIEVRAGKRFERWLNFRELTVKAAVQADGVAGQGDWDAAYSLLDSTRRHLVIMVLLDRVL